MSRNLSFYLLRQCPILHSGYKALCISPIKGYVSSSEASLSSLKKSSLGQTSLFFQDGTSIQELPMVVRNLHDNDLDIASVSTIQKDELAKTLSEDEYYEMKEMVAGFERCYSAKGVFKLLELIPSAEVTPEVALQALKSVFRLENNQEFRNILGPSSNDEKAENFTRSAVLKNLVSVICQSENAHVVLEGLTTLSKDVASGNFVAFRDQLCDEVLLRAAESKFSIAEICNAVRAFALLDRKEHGDKLWLGLVENQKDVNQDNIVDVVQILPYLKKSRRLVLNLAQKKLEELWCQLQAADIVDIMSVMHKLGLLSERVILVFSGWISTNIHRLTETELLPIVELFGQMPISEKGVEKSFEKYVKAKGLRIKNPAVIVGIADYCKKFKVRSSLILNGCSEYLINRRQDLSSSQLTSLFVLFGVLDFHPDAGVKFWEVFEEELHQRFVQLSPNDALDVMLSCVYLEKHPLNFIRKIFNPYFLDRLHSVKQPFLLTALRSKLKILDTAMTLECPLYRGPLLPRDHTAKALWHDGRIKRAANSLVSALRGTVDGFVSSSVILGQLPLHEIYVVDVLLHPRPLKSPHIPFIDPDAKYTAVLLHVPEHYDSSGTHLLGPQVMRQRHLRKIGLTVVELDVTVIQKLHVHPEQVREYFNEQLSVAVPPSS